MPDIKLCPTCKRRLSERMWVPKVGDTERPSRNARCLDPLHDLADRAPELEAERDALAKRVEELEAALRLFVGANATRSTMLHGGPSAPWYSSVVSEAEMDRARRALDGEAG